MTEMTERLDDRRRRGGVVGPVILIGAGIVLLLTNLGMLSFDTWGTLFRLWPVLLIAVGLDILIGRRSWLGSLVIAVLLLAVLAWAILAGGNIVASGGVALSNDNVSQPLEGATRGEIRIASGAGKLRISAADENADLIQGQVALANGERAVVDHNKVGDTMTFSLRSQGLPTNWPSGSTWANRVWDLKLNRDVPLSLSLDGSVGEGTIDLSQTKVTQFTMDGGVGQNRVTLPRQGQVTASIDGGVGDLTIIIPAGMEGRIHANGGLGQTNTPAGWTHHDNEYTSAGYNGAQNRVDLTVNGGIGQITIKAGG
jgi:hypothetical protein